jgi:hypothetical protein
MLVSKYLFNITQMRTHSLLIILCGLILCIATVATAETVISLTSTVAINSVKSVESTKTQGDFNQGFTLKIAGIPIANITRLSDLVSEQEVVEYKDGQDQTTRYRPGNIKTGTIKITREWSNKTDFYTWRKTVIDGKVERKSISIIFLNDDTEAREHFRHK